MVVDGSNTSTHLLLCNNIQRYSQTTTTHGRTLGSISSSVHFASRQWPRLPRSWTQLILMLLLCHSISRLLISLVVFVRIAVQTRKAVLAFKRVVTAAADGSQRDFVVGTQRAGDRYRRALVLSSPTSQGISKGRREIWIEGCTSDAGLNRSKRMIRDIRRPRM